MYNGSFFYYSHLPGKRNASIVRYNLATRQSIQVPLPRNQYNLNQEELFAPLYQPR